MSSLWRWATTTDQNRQIVVFRLGRPATARPAKADPDSARTWSKLAVQICTDYPETTWGLVAGCGRTGFESSPKGQMENGLPIGDIRINLANAAGGAPANGFEDRWEARVACADLDACVMSEESLPPSWLIRPGRWPSRVTRGR